jgi:hypothetical protein
MAIKNEDTLLNMFESPYCLRAIQVREAVSGKYRNVRKEVVSDFIKELIAWMGFLNRARKDQLPRRGSLGVCFP